LINLISIIGLLCPDRSEKQVPKALKETSQLGTADEK